MSPQPPTPLPRSYLFVPGDRPERMPKAAASGADAVVLDLEDAVAEPAKAGARTAVARGLEAAWAVDAIGGGSTTHSTAPDRPVWVVRINAETSAHFETDLAWLAALERSRPPPPAASASAWAVMLPQAERADTLARVRQACPSADLLPLVESARGVAAAAALAAAPGVQRLVFGTLDYALDLGLEGEAADTLGLDMPAALLAIASRAVGIAAPVAGVTVVLDDPTRLLADFARMRALGFAAKLCIHPRQVAHVHAALRPPEAELAWARRVLDLVDQADPRAPVGALQLDGRMVDRPVIERARQLLARAGP